MNQLDAYVRENCAFLYTDHGASCIDEKSDSGNALLVLVTADLQLRFVRDRGQLFLELRSRHVSSDAEWFSLDLVQQLLTDEIDDQTPLGDSRVNFLERHFADISKAFAGDQARATSFRLHELARARAKRLFG